MKKNPIRIRTNPGSDPISLNRDTEEVYGIRPTVEAVEPETDGGVRAAHLLRTLWGLVEAGWGYEEVAWVFDLDPVLVRDAHVNPS